MERLHIADCAIVKCSKELEDAVTMICEDVGSIGPVGTGEDQSIGGTINAVLGGIQGVLDTKVINAVQYVLLKHPFADRINSLSGPPAVPGGLACFRFLFWGSKKRGLVPTKPRKTACIL